jgi:hypothetical protein
MPVALPVSTSHTRNFLDAIRHRRRAICDVDTALWSDTLCQLALIATRRGSSLNWDPVKEHFTDDSAANALLKARPFRGSWRLPEAG